MLGVGLPEALQENVTVSVSLTVLLVGAEVKLTGTTEP